jgi:hypothetical protein
MNLGEFRDRIKQSNVSEFKFGISEPFSWRGSYDEVAFSILKEPMDKREILNRIGLAFVDTFSGWKGGEYNYDQYTTVHFEKDWGSYSGGDYVLELLFEMIFPIKGEN